MDTTRTHSTTLRAALVGSAVGAAVVVHAQNISLVNLDTAGTPQVPSVMTAPVAMSGFGRYVAFSSNAQLTAADTNAFDDVYVKDMQTGTLALVSVTTAGGQGDNHSGYSAGGPGFPGFPNGGASISWTGRFVVFNSIATNLDPNDDNNFADCFIHDRDVSGDGVFDQAGDISTTRVSVSSTGAEANFPVTGPPTVSRDGRYVVFTSTATNLVPNDTNARPDVFLRDVYLGTTTRVNLSTGGAVDNGALGLVPESMISPNGRFVLFSSGGSNLVANDTNNAFDVFLRDMDTDLDGVLNEPNATATFLVSSSTSGAVGNGSSTLGAISYDGSYVMFNSDATDLVGSDTNSASDVFVRDVFASTTTRVSVDSSGNEANAGSFSTGTISSDGRFIAMHTSATNLVSGNLAPIVLHDRDTDMDGILDEPGAIGTTRYGLLPSGQPALINVPGLHPLCLSAGGRAFAYQVRGGNGIGIYLAETDADSDGDGLLDTWETNGGIDIDGDALVDLLLPNCNPNHKDLFIEIDVMLSDPARTPAIGNLGLSQATMNTLVQRFAAIPAQIAQNPDGLPGITLHLQVDQTTIPFQRFDPGGPWNGPTTPPFAPSQTFTWHRQTYFGTNAERTNPLWTQMRALKLHTHHYCLFADSVGATTMGGQGEMPGNAFYVTMGNWPNGGTQSERAGVFLHELGHNLGLGHGGADMINYKPNYLSVMDYADTVPSTCYGGWTLGFSGSTWVTLDEKCVDETVGIVGGRGSAFRVPYRAPTSGNTCAATAPEGGAFDFDGDSVLNPCACVDLNTVIAGATQVPGEILFGHNDLANLWLPMVGDADFYNGPAVSLSPDEDLTRENLVPVDAPTFLLDDFNMYPAGQANLYGGWEVWCEGGMDATFTNEVFRSAPTSLKVERPESGPIGSDIVRPFHADGCQWRLSMWTFVPSGNAGSGYAVALNQYCEPTNNFSMQVEFDASAGVVREFNGSELPLLFDTWVELRAEIDLDNDWLNIYYDDQPLALDLIWSLNVSGMVGNPGIRELTAIDLVAQDIREMYFDDLALELVDCPPPPICEADWNFDGVADVIDLLEFLAGWFEMSPDRDVNFDGLVDVIDLLQFLGFWFAGCD